MLVRSVRGAAAAADTDADGLIRSTIQDFLDCQFQFEWLEPGRSGPALVGDLAVCADQVQAVGPSAVRFVDRVVERVDHGGDREFELRTHLLAHFGAGVERIGLQHEDLFAPVGRNLPAVDRVCFADVDHHELDVALVRLVHPFQGASLAPEGRSRVRTEHQGDGLTAFEVRQRE